MRRVLLSTLSIGACSLLFNPDRDAYIEQTTSLCQDGVDNDGVDGMDCDDPKCAHTLACEPCGDGILDAGEACDDGNTTPGDTCDPNCQTPGCGNGFLAPNESCYNVEATQPVGGGPSGIALGDFDGDHRLDIATGNFNTSDVTVLTNQISANAIFAFGRVDFPLDSAVPDIVTGDFNGDGLEDIAAPVKFVNEFATLISQGNSFLVTQLGVEGGIDGDGIGDHPFGMATGDADGDGTLDILVSNFDSGDVTILPNDGDGTFEGSTQNSTDVDSIPEHVEATDLNGDSLVDFATTNTGSGNITIAISQGIGIYTTTLLNNFAGNPVALALADLDADGDSDLVALNSSTGEAQVYSNIDNFQGLAPIGFSLKQTIGLGMTPGGLALADIDNDGDRDLVVGGDSVLIFFFDSASGDFATVPISLNANGSTKEIAVGDFNNDGTPDIAALNLSLNGVTVFLNQP